MKDRFDREIDYLRISVTDRCNLRCMYCMPDGIEKISHDEVISDEDIIKVVKQGIEIGIKKIRITGGEPLVRKGIFELIKKINELNGIDEIVLTTNGTLLLGNVKKLKQSGVSRVNLSIDSLQENKRNKISNTTVGLNYISLIHELQSNNITPIKVNVVLLRNINDDEILDFYNFAIQFDLIVRFIELMPFESNSFNYKDYYISKDEILMRYPEFHLESKTSNVEYYKTKNSNMTIGFINAISSKFCEECNRLRLTSDGYVKPCLHSNGEIYVKDKSKEEVISSLKEAVNKKPKQHTLDKEYKNQAKRSMNKIGG